MTDGVFSNQYWKQFLLLEKEFRKTTLYVALSIENNKTYSDFYAKLLLQIGSEVDVAAKLLCKEINSGTSAENIIKYRDEIMPVYPEIENVTIDCAGIAIIPWKNWTTDSPTWWKIYNGVKHNRGGVETYDGETKENYKFANLKTVSSALAGLYLLELYLYQRVTDREPQLDTPLPGSRLFKPKDHRWENKKAYRDTTFILEGEMLKQVVGDYEYGDL